MSSTTTTFIEWACTLLSIGGSWLCIKHRASGFVVFLVADFGWFVSAWMNSHSSLIAQQFIYILLNLVGYVMWRKDERLRCRLQIIQANRDFDSFPHDRYSDLQLLRAAA
jgi:nicotinamide riboside transporter PnuC